MYIELNHQKLLVVTEVRKMVSEVYKVLRSFPAEERYAMCAQLRRAVLSVFLNISEGCSRISMQERKRYFEIARGSLIEVDSIFDIANDLGYLNKVDQNILQESILSSFRLLSNLIRSLQSNK